MTSMSSSGSFRNTDSFLRKMIAGDFYGPIERIAQEGVQALSAATPQDDGSTAMNWAYEIQGTGAATTVWFTNSSVVDGFNIAVGLQYGHATGNGGYVVGRDYINPALKPIFDKIADEVWKEVQKA